MGRFWTAILTVFAIIAAMQQRADSQISEVYPRGWVVPVDLAPGRGVTLNFRPLGQEIERVWVDRQTFFTINSDGCLAGLSEGGNSERGGRQASCSGPATLLHLRAIERLNIPGIKYSNSALITVVVKGSDVPFLFAVSPADYSNVLVYNVVRPNGPPNAELIAAFERGIERVRGEKRLPPSSPLWARLESARRLLAEGNPLERVAAESGVSEALLQQLIESGSSVNLQNSGGI